MAINMEELKAQLKNVEDRLARLKSSILANEQRQKDQEKLEALRSGLMEKMKQDLAN